MGIYSHFLDHKRPIRIPRVNKSITSAYNNLFTQLCISPIISVRIGALVGFGEMVNSVFQVSVFIYVHVLMDAVAISQWHID